jgi:hypothetical protein
MADCDLSPTDGHLAKGVGQKGRLTVEINAKDIELLRQFQLKRNARDAIYNILDIKETAQQLVAE